MNAAFVETDIEKDTVDANLKQAKKLEDTEHKALGVCVHGSIYPISQRLRKHFLDDESSPSEAGNGAGHPYRLENVAIVSASR